MDVDFIIEQLNQDIGHLYERRDSLIQLLDDNSSQIEDKQKQLWQLFKGIKIGQDIIVNNKFNARLVDLKVYDNGMIVPMVNYYLVGNKELSPINTVLPSSTMIAVIEEKISDLPKVSELNIKSTLIELN